MARDNAFSLKVWFYFKHLFCFFFFLHIHLGHNTLPNRKSIFRWRMQKQSSIKRHLLGSGVVWVFQLFRFSKTNLWVVKLDVVPLILIHYSLFFPPFMSRPLSCLSFRYISPGFIQLLNYRLFSGVIPQQFHPKWTWFKRGHEVCVICTRVDILYHLNRISPYLFLK